MPTMPSSPKFATFTFREVWSTPATTSPFSGDVQVYKWTGSNKYEWDATLPLIKDNTIKANWIAFLLDMEGRSQTFSYDLNADGGLYDYLQGQTTASQNWRLREPVVGWTIDINGFLSGITIKAREA